ncbi:MAG: cytochrome c family protein [Proteobacteria bacterium]|nr:cytochrome c family protein [Pseudomonadota bacterium]MBU1581119.1 cytochrome c family protein [Pseudomonadota bacterium]MBU2454818.1 cytochrome c family protein [Pseudomonadota bacterium]MBU2628711.1 cytochrome c family protein [Pseudomonadota bacterium]
MKNYIIIGVVFLCFFCVSTGFAEDKAYIGSTACKDCHEKEYANYMKYAKKAGSFESIKKMKTKLTPEEYESCFECHTTGYGKKGGFVSEEKTPDLRDAGCEVCHGPGSSHAESQDPDLIIRDVKMENCNTCHNKDRIEAFDFKPLLFGGAH